MFIAIFQTTPVAYAHEWRQNSVQPIVLTGAFELTSVSRALHPSIDYWRVSGGLKLDQKWFLIYN